MKDKAYKKYLKEADNWLHSGRSLLLENCLNLFSPNESGKDGSLRILEVGAGSGRNIPILSRYGNVDAIEIEPLAIQQLTENPQLKKLYTDRVPFSLNGKYHVICSMDFLEHVEDDGAVFQWMVNHLHPGGLIFVTVPAYPWLFSFHDTALGHYRRYTTEGLCSLAGSNINLQKKGYFNCTLFPLVAVIRLLSRLVPDRSDTDEKQSSNVPPIINGILSCILRVESSFIRKHSLFPFGLTAFAVFRKDQETK